jgi:hypothetical protein
MLLTATDLSKDEADAFKLWKANAPLEGREFAGTVNTWMAMRVPLPPSWQPAVTTLQGLFSRSFLPDPETLFRATSDLYVAPHIRDHVLTYPSFMATSRDDVQRHFSGVPNPAAFLIIYCPDGLPALDGEMFPEFGGHEREILLQPETRFADVGRFRGDSGGRMRARRD